MLHCLVVLICFGLVAAENGLNGWLRVGKWIQGILGQILRRDSDKGSGKSSIIVGTVDQYILAYGDIRNLPELEQDGFWLNIKDDSVQILGQNERGALYGAFEYLSRIGQGNFDTTKYASNPSAPIRWTNEWDNLDERGSDHGSVERGYGGPSIFFRFGVVLNDPVRWAQYARLLASIRVNAVVVNNVNANASLLNPVHIEGLGRIADAFRPYGVQLGFSLNFASPTLVGGLTTFDPLDTGVITWWTNITNQIYQRIPDMAGYLVKANSEGQPGPLTYNRTLADGANLFARAVEPHGGVVMFRAFVYNKLNDSDWKADRANAAVEFFKELDGKFKDNVVVQIKYGAIDFQVREPVNPLFANLHHTSTAIELQVSQEYLGQQAHIVYLPPLWKSILDFDLRVDQQRSLTREIVTGKRFKRSLGGFAAVVNVGTDPTWLGSHLAMSNLYAYGRLAWDPTAQPKDILQDWIRLTFGFDKKVTNTITDISLKSWPAYEKYTGNLGIQTLTDILYTHYGPNPASQDNNGWGQWTRANRVSIGMDRTVSNGTGNAGQYPTEIARIYENVDSTPDDLLLWFHHVPYTHRLRSGKTVIQHFYDAHYEGAAIAQTFVTAWESLKDKIDKERYDHVLFRQKYQAGHSIVWRDAINHYYWNLSSIPDEAKRVGNHPYRIEAESLVLSGYEVVKVTPFETASNYTAIVTSSSSTGGVVSTTLNFPSGTYNIAVNYFDHAGGQSHWQTYINNQPLGEWYGNLENILGHFPSSHIDGHSATRITFQNVKIRRGDVLKIVGTPNGTERAPLDYVSILPLDIID
ncbi:glycoside hydrolase superfamily [Bisporella sp. PMI_857]|nr:glycoside hydrolase superfamily [Bisporella sp. PMI_857]